METDKIWTRCPSCGYCKQQSFRLEIVKIIGKVIRKFSWSSDKLKASGSNKMFIEECNVVEHLNDLHYVCDGCGKNITTIYNVKTTVQNTTCNNWRHV